MKHWELKYHLVEEPNRIRELLVLTGDDERSALEYLNDKIRVENPEASAVVVHYCIPQRQQRYQERHCAHCGSDCRELIREPVTTPPGSRDPANWRTITIERKSNGRYHNPDLRNGTGVLGGSQPRVRVVEGEVGGEPARLDGAPHPYP